MAGTGLCPVSAGTCTDGAGLTAQDYIADSEVRRINFGIVQTFDSAGLDVFAMVDHYSADLTFANTGNPRTKDASLEDWTGVMIGSRIKF
jgi:hypothetical protein